jgi:hypothetical protein
MYFCKFWLYHFQSLVLQDSYIRGCFPVVEWLQIMGQNEPTATRALIGVDGG